MIKIDYVYNNGYERENRVEEINLDSYGDGTLKCFLEIDEKKVLSDVNITWCYDNDKELFALECLCEYLDGKGLKKSLSMPYIPNARHDRRFPNYLFTLKTFCRIINRLKFTEVWVLDPHSDVSAALIDNLHTYNCDVENIEQYDAIVFPDAGSGKRYFTNKIRNIIGVKHRDENGDINYYHLENFEGNIKKVIIRDDICASGGTLLECVKALKEKGVEDITVMVSHCENRVVKSGLLDNINKLLTTDSICTLDHPKISYIKKYREVQ